MKDHSKSFQLSEWGGIGKTTLARAVYEDKDIVGHFDVCLWVTISQQYNIQDILLSLLPKEQAAEEIEEDIGSLSKSVYQSLYNRRFLIVLDDMWDAEAWNGVMMAIPNDMNGSRVILTTRLSDVAETVSSSCPQHEISLLDEDQSWDLLRKKVYGQEICRAEFEAVGRRIAENCNGLPVRIVVVAGMLKSNMTEDYWGEVERNINELAAAAPGGDHGQLDGVLSLSYDNLPPHLKSCFLYFGAYPEDQVINAEELIWLWVAEGFVAPKANSKTLEEIGEEYLEDLVKRSLVLVGERDVCDGKIRLCGIHDMLRELSLIKAKQDKFLQCFTQSDGVTLQNIMKSQLRRVSVLSTEYDDSLSFPVDDTCSTSTRSLLFMDIRSPPLADEQLVWLLPSWRPKLLKVLFGVEVTNDSMFSHLFELITNLKLLHFSISIISRGLGYGSWDSSRPSLVVPESISKLQKLETLIVSSRAGAVLTLPVDIWKIHELRHIQIDVDVRCTLALPPTEVSEAYPVLQHLQTLGIVYNLELTESLIRRMPNLKELRIGYLLNYNYVTECGLKNIVGLCQLETLVLWTGVKAKGYLPADFVFPKNLKRLDLRGHHIFCSWEHMSSVVGSLPNLQELKLNSKAVDGSTWEPEEGQFLQLKYLKMKRLRLKCWVADSAHFPCLEVLVLRDMEKLEEIPLDIGYIPTLRQLNVRYCSYKVRKSAKEIQKEQQGLANHALRVEICHYAAADGDGDDDDEEEEEEDYSDILSRLML